MYTIPHKAQIIRPVINKYSNRNCARLSSVRYRIENSFILSLSFHINVKLPTRQFVDCERLQEGLEGFPTLGLMKRYLLRLLLKFYLCPKNNKK